MLRCVQSIFQECIVQIQFTEITYQKLHKKMRFSNEKYNKTINDLIQWHHYD